MVNQHLVSTFHGFLAAALYCAAPVEVHAMQNPIYSGVNRVHLECQDAGITPVGFCDQLKKAIAERYRLSVESVSRSESKDANGNRLLGVLTLRLESSDEQRLNKVRLIWQNSNQSNSQPIKVVGDWITISSSDDIKLSTQQLAEKLLDTSPR